MRRFLAFAVLLACALSFAACHHSHPVSTRQQAPPAAVTGHPCASGDYYMQCALAPRGPSAVAPPLGLHVSAYGVDFAWSCPLPAGARFGASYLSPDRSKNWTRACIDAYHRSGRNTVVVWESSAARALSGYSAGVADAHTAGSQAAALGKPSSRPIYFAVDFDTTPNPGAILAYFRGVDHVLGRGRTGGYGGLATIRVLLANRLIAYGWQTAAWSRGIWDPRAQLQQYGFTGSLDWDRATRPDYGQWPYAHAKPKPRPKPVTASQRQRCQELNGIRRNHHRTHHWQPKGRGRAIKRGETSHHLRCVYGHPGHLERTR